MERPAQSKILHNIQIWAPVAKRYIPAAARFVNADRKIQNY